MKVVGGVLIAIEITLIPVPCAILVACLN
jgi:hypothetical protein